MLQLGWYTTQDGRQAQVISHVADRFVGHVDGMGRMSITWDANGKRKRIRSLDKVYGWGNTLDLKLTTFQAERIVR